MTDTSVSKTTEIVASLLEATESGRVRWAQDDERSFAIKASGIEARIVNGVEGGFVDEQGLLFGVRRRVPETQFYELTITDETGEKLILRDHAGLRSLYNLARESVVASFRPKVEKLLQSLNISEPATSQ